MAISTRVVADADPYVDGLLSGLAWQGALTFGFPESAEDLGNGYGRGEPLLGFSHAPAGLRRAVADLLLGSAPPEAGDALGAAMGIRQFTRLDVRHAEAGEADIRVAQSSLPPTAWAYRPGSGEGGDVWFGKVDTATGHDFRLPVLGTYSHLTVMHELGHALGLKHSHEAGPINGDVVPRDMDAFEFTVMSYRSFPGSSPSYTFERYGAPRSFMMLDIAALQRMYGANFAHNAGDTVYSWSPADGAASIDGARRAALGENRVFETVWDGGGVDTYDFSEYSEALSIDLRPGRWSTLSRAQLALLGPGVHAQGNVYNALQYSGDARSLIENALGGSRGDSIQGNAADNRLVGNAGDDTLFGGAGDDVLDGCAGRDTVEMRAVGLRGLDGVGASGEVLTVTSADGADTLLGVEVVQFADGRLVFDAEDAAARVTRLYEAALDRLPDQHGLNFWIDLVQFGTSLSDLASGFLDSDEFRARFDGAAGDGAFVDRLYLNALGREGEAAGKRFWLDLFGSGTKRADVLVGFSESAENKAGTAALVQRGIWDRSETAAEVARLYDAVLGRAPDAPGLAGWTTKIDSGAVSLAQAADGFTRSTEFQAKYGSLDNRGFVTGLYRNALDREPDRAGLDGWVDLLDGGVARSDVVLGFSESAEHVALTAAAIGGEHPGQFGILFA